jgi:hypothetical protein
MCNIQRLSANLSRESVILMGRKWALFVSLSTITHTSSCPLGSLGRPTTKSIAIWSHFHIGTSRGWSCLASLWCSAFTSWQEGHYATYSATLHFMPHHQIFFYRSWYILLLPGWTVYCVWWVSSIISPIKSTLLEITVLPLLVFNVPLSVK